MRVPDVPRLGAVTIAGVLFTCGVVVAGPAASAAEAEALRSFPEHPVTILVPRGAGGGSHQLCVTMAEALKEELGVEVKVVNKPGKEGIAAIEELMALPPNGYTILQHVDDDRFIVDYEDCMSSSGSHVSSQFEWVL